MRRNRGGCLGRSVDESDGEHRCPEWAPATDVSLELVERPDDSRRRPTELAVERSFGGTVAEAVRKASDQRYRDGEGGQSVAAVGDREPTSGEESAEPASGVPSLVAGYIVRMAPEPGEGGDSDEDLSSGGEYPTALAQQRFGLLEVLENIEESDRRKASIWQVEAIKR